MASLLGQPWNARTSETGRTGGGILLQIEHGHARRTRHRPSVQTLSWRRRPSGLPRVGRTCTFLGRSFVVAAETLMLLKAMQRSGQRRRRSLWGCRGCKARVVEGRTACFGSCSPFEDKARWDARSTASWTMLSLAKKAAALDWMVKWRPLLGRFRGRAECS